MEPARQDPQAGSMAVEMTLMTPVLVAFLLLVISAGRFVAVRGEVEAAGRDAARAASMTRDLGSATLAAQQASNVFVDGRWRCAPVQLGESDWRPGGTVTVTLSCQVRYADLGLIGLPGSVTVTRNSSAPLDEYRRTTVGGAGTP